jgi:hypothetical protein
MKFKKALWKCTLCRKTWDKDEINVEAFIAHHVECRKKMNKRYKNREEPIAKPENVKKIEGKN